MDKWNNVDDSLPEFGVIVLVAFDTIAGNKQYKVAELINYKYCAHHDRRIPTWFGVACRMGEISRVTHWQELTPLPKGN